MMRVNFRGYGNGKLIFQEYLEIEEDQLDQLIPHIAVNHVKKLPRKHMIEIEFLDRDEEDRFFRFGTDPTMMAIPQEVDLEKCRNNPTKKSDAN